MLAPVSANYRFRLPGDSRAVLPAVLSVALSAVLGGPGRLGGQDFGYYLYSEFEDSGSYYRESGVEQTMLQASFDADLTDRLQVQFGGMYHDFTGNQIAGWNRLTQELVDRGTYITGQPLPLDTDGDGLISHQEFDVDAVHSGFSNSVTLPGYTLVNAGLVVERGDWTFTAAAKNLTDERYFRANFPNLFGGVIVLPELPRYYQARIQYRW